MVFEDFFGVDKKDGGGVKKVGKIKKSQEKFGEKKNENLVLLRVKSDF